MHSVKNASMKFNIVAFMSTILLFFLLPLVINAILQQAQLITLQKIVFSYSRISLYVLPLISVAAIYFSKNVRVIRLIQVPLLLMLSYLFILCIWQSNMRNFAYISRGYLGFFHLFFVALLVSFIPSVYSSRRIENVIIFLGTVCGAIGISQYVLNQPLLSIKDAEGKFEVINWLFSASNPMHVRAFSLFTNALELGIFLIFCIGIAIYKFNSKRFTSVAILVMLVASYCTLTRNVYVGIFAAISSAILYKYVNRRSFLLALPVISLLIGLITSSGVKNLFSSGIGNTDTLNVRAFYWEKENKYQLHNYDYLYFFGEGRYQVGDEKSGGLIFVDNSYLQIIAQSGVVGLIIFIIFYYCLLYWVISQRKSGLMSGLFAFLIAWPAIAMFNIIFSQMAAFLIIVLLHNSNKPEEINYEAK